MSGEETDTLAEDEETYRYRLPQYQLHRDDVPKRVRNEYRHAGDDDEKDRPYHVFEQREDEILRVVGEPPEEPIGGCTHVFSID